MKKTWKKSISEIELTGTLNFGLLIPDDSDTSLLRVQYCILFFGVIITHFLRKMILKIPET